MERPSLMTLWMQFQRARRALGSMPVVGSSCNKKNGQDDIGPEVDKEDDGKGEEQGEEHHLVNANCSSKVCAVPFTLFYSVFSNQSLL